MCSYRIDIVLKHIHIGKNMVIYTLKNVFDFSFRIGYFKGVVDVSVAKRFCCNHILINLKLIQDVKQLCVCFFHVFYSV
jgi:hypothetical protein